MLGPSSLSTWCFLEAGDGEALDLPAVVELIVGGGYGVEFSGYYHKDPDALDRRYWADWKARTAGAPAITVHSNHSRRDHATVLGELRFLAYVGGRALVVHPGQVTREDDPSAPDEKLLGEWVRQAAGEGLYVALENIGPDDVLLLDRCLEQFGPRGPAGGFATCLDVGHAVMSARRVPGDLELMVERFASHMVAAHLHEVYDGVDHHLPGRGDGQVPWDRVGRVMGSCDACGVGALEIWMGRDGGAARAWLNELDKAVAYLRRCGMMLA